MDSEVPHSSPFAAAPPPLPSGASERSLTLDDGVMLASASEDPAMGTTTSVAPAPVVLVHPSGANNFVSPSSTTSSTTPSSTTAAHATTNGTTGTTPAAAAATATATSKTPVYDPLAAMRELEEMHDGREEIFRRESNYRKPTTLAFENLSFSVGNKKILQNVSGYAQPGHVVAIMGPSGAGKTTLLDFLAGRVSMADATAAISGTVLVDGEKRNFDTFRKQSAYVLQTDIFFSELTVRETITLSALLRLPKDMPNDAKMQRVDLIIKELGLGKCQNTPVGNELIRGVSGGERKRLNVATELVTDPSLIFLDEPTSGLDSFNAQSVMQMLLKLAKNGRTVVTTIHQPRSSIFQLFDHLLLLSEGRPIYFGPAQSAVDYFGRIGFQCPPMYNPSDYFMDLLAIDNRNSHLEKVTKVRARKLADIFAVEETKLDLPRISKGSFAHHSALSPSHTSAADLEGNASVLSSGKYATSWLYQFGQLTFRSLRSTVREKANNIAMLGQTVLFSVLLGLIWLNNGGDKSGPRLQSIAGLLFFVIINQAFVGMFGILFLFPAERAIVLKERSSRTYHVGAYFWSKTMSEFPRTLMINAIFCIFTYFMVGLRPGAGYFFVYFVIISFSQLSAEGIAYVVSALAKDPQQGGAIAPAFIVTGMLFAGFYIGSDTMPVWIGWLKYISFLKYGFAAAMQNEYADRSLDLSTCTLNFCPKDGNAVLAQYEVDQIPLYANFLILLAMIVILRLVAYAILLRKGPKFNTTI